MYNKKKNNNKKKFFFQLLFDPPPSWEGGGDVSWSTPIRGMIQLKSKGREDTYHVAYGERESWAHLPYGNVVVVVVVHPHQVVAGRKGTETEKLI